MTQYIHDDGIVSAVTALEVGPCVVTQVKNSEKDGYDKIQIGYKQVPEKKMSNPEKGHLKKNGLDLFKYLREVDSVDSNDQQIGSVVTISQIFEVGDIVDVIGKSKGKGFAGAIKRWNFSSQRMTHGNSLSHRAPGSIGQNQSPGKVFKGKKMAGHMGDKFRTIQNLEIIKSDTENNLIYIKGSIPGSKNSLVLIKKNSKKINKKTTLEKIAKLQTEVTTPTAKTKEKVKTPEKKESPKTEKSEKKDLKK